MIGKTGAHVIGDQVEERQRRQAQNQLDRLQHTLVGVKSGIHPAALAVGADGQRHGAMAIHVVHTILRVVLDNEDRHLGPELRFRKAFHHLAHGQVIVGHHGLRGRCSRTRAIRMIGRQLQQNQIRHLPFPLPGGHIFQENLRAHHIGNAVRVTRVILRQNLIHRSDGGRDIPLTGVILAPFPGFQQRKTIARRDLTQRAGVLAIHFDAFTSL